MKVSRSRVNEATSSKGLKPTQGGLKPNQVGLKPT